MRRLYALAVIRQSSHIISGSRASRRHGHDGMMQAAADTGTHSSATAPAGRPVRARDHLSARLGDRPLRFPLRLLHVGKHELPAEGRSAHAGRARPAVQRLRGPRRPEAAVDRRRAAGAARHHDADRLAVAPSRRPARWTSSRSPPMARSFRNMPPNSPASASSASTSRSTRSIRKNSAPSRAGASSTRFWPASTRRRRPACASRSTRSRSRASTRTRSPTWCNGRMDAAWTSRSSR